MQTRVLASISALCLAGTYFVPMWYIILSAPQFPEGLGLNIWLHGIEGRSPFDLQNINLLNHYIGMADIVPAQLIEFKLLPIAMLIPLSGLVVSIIFKLQKLYLPCALFLVLIGIVGLVDFNHWEYVYGHNLNPHAPIKIPGMVYDPPFLGVKQLLNFTAISIPGFGVVLALLATVFAYGASINRKMKLKGGSHQLLANLGVFLFMCLTLSLNSCANLLSPQPKAIAWGIDTCAFCKMNIVDRQTWCELSNSHGKIYLFDSLTCLHKFSQGKKNNITKMWAGNFVPPHKPIDINQACFLLTNKRNGSMGQCILTFANKQEIIPYQNMGRMIFSWSVLKLALDKSFYSSTVSNQ